MYISIGTRSLPKISAVCSAFSAYPELCFRDGDLLQFMILPEKQRGSATDNAIDSVSKVSCNPLTLEELTTGAKNRAKEAYRLCAEQHGACAYGVGIEGGLFPVEGTETGYLDTSICAIYDGERFAIGGSPLFEYPQAVMQHILAGEEPGFLADFFGPNAKGRAGSIGPLSNGRVLRDEFDRYAVLMALTRLVSPELYSR